MKRIIILLFLSMYNVANIAMCPAQKYPQLIWEISEIRKKSAQLDQILRPERKSYISHLPKELQKELALYHLFTIPIENSLKEKIKYCKTILGHPLLEKESQETNFNGKIIKYLAKNDNYLMTDLAIAQELDTQGALRWKEKNQFYFTLNDIVNDSQQAISVQITGLNKKMVYKLDPHQLVACNKKIGYLGTNTIRLIVTCGNYIKIFKPSISLQSSVKGEWSLCLARSIYNHVTHQKQNLPLAGFEMSGRMGLFGDKLEINVGADNSIALKISNTILEDVPRRFGPMQLIGNWVIFS